MKTSEEYELHHVVQNVDWKSKRRRFATAPYPHYLSMPRLRLWRDRMRANSTAETVIVVEIPQEERATAWFACSAYDIIQAERGAHTCGTRHSRHEVNQPRIDDTNCPYPRRTAAELDGQTEMDAALDALFGDLYTGFVLTAQDARRFVMPDSAARQRVRRCLARHGALGPKYPRIPDQRKHIEAQNAVSEVLSANPYMFKPRKQTGTSMPTTA